MGKTSKKLKNTTLADIHAASQRIKGKPSKVAAFFAVSSAELARQLGKFQMPGQGSSCHLTFQGLCQLSSKQASVYFGMEYHKPIVQKRVSVDKYTIAHIHKQIIQLRNEHCLTREVSAFEVSTLLDTVVETLRQHLNKFPSLGMFDRSSSPLTFEYLCSLSAEEVARYFPDNSHDLLMMEGKRNNPNAYSLADIHRAILQASGISNACTVLKISTNTLQSWIAKFELDGKPLTFESLKNLSFQRAGELYGEQYNRYFPDNSHDLLMMEGKRNNPNAYSLADIHRAILQASGISNACTVLKISTNTLQSWIAKFELDGKPLTFESLKNLSFQRAGELYGEQYNALLRKTPLLCQRTMADIHEKIRESKSLSQASSLLGVNQNALKDHLSRFTFDETNRSFTYTYLCNLSVPAAKKKFGTQYDQPMVIERVDLWKYSMSHLHKTILNVKTFRQAARSLHSSRSSLKKHLMHRFKLCKKSSVLEQLKKLSPNEAVCSFGKDKYYGAKSAVTKCVDPSKDTAAACSQMRSTEEVPQTVSLLGEQKYFSRQKNAHTFFCPSALTDTKTRLLQELESLDTAKRVSIEHLRLFVEEERQVRTAVGAPFFECFVIDVNYLRQFLRCYLKCNSCNPNENQKFQLIVHHEGHYLAIDVLWGVYEKKCLLLYATDDPYKRAPVYSVLNDFPFNRIFIADKLEDLEDLSDRKNSLQQDSHSSAVFAFDHAIGLSKMPDIYKNLEISMPKAVIRKLKLVSWEILPMQLIWNAQSRDFLWSYFEKNVQRMNSDEKKRYSEYITKNIQTSADGKVSNVAVDNIFKCVVKHAIALLQRLDENQIMSIINPDYVAYADQMCYEENTVGYGGNIYPNFGSR